MGFPVGASGKEPTCQCRRYKRLNFEPWLRKIPWRRAWQPTPVFLPGKSHGQRSLTGYSSWGCKELDTTERLHFTSLQDFSIYMCFFNCLNCICSFFSLILFIFSLSNHKPELCPFFPPGSFDFLCKVNIQEKHEYSGLCNFQKNWTFMKKSQRESYELQNATH